MNPSGIVKRRSKADFWTRLAARKAYPARSVFKLEEMDERFDLFSRGDRVLDLGASPGSWTKYISGRVGGDGIVVCIDRNPMRIVLPQNARFIKADVLEIEPEEIRTRAECGAFDAVVSDLAPLTTGIRHADQENSWVLFERALMVAERLLKRGGNFAGKLFFSPRHAEAITRMKHRFQTVLTVHTKATRKKSKEIFIVGREFKPEACSFTPAG